MDIKYKILIADDSQMIRRTIQNYLLVNNPDKYHIIEANNGKEACKKASEMLPDLIMMDIEMPLMDGITAIKKIKHLTKLENIPIIVMTSRKEFPEAVNVGANDFILKPFTQQELILRVKINLDLAQKSNEIKRQNELLNTQKTEVTTQRDEIHKQQRELIADYTYASFVQNAIMPKKEIFESLFNSYFILNLPKNVISGDFYWISVKNNLKIICVGDCTGHGISGALMTMVGIAFLNEIVNEKAILEADQILNELRIRVIKLLDQKGDIGEASNGMDLSLCIFDENTGTIQFAGANNPIYIIRNNSQIEIYKGDRMPIGFYFRDSVLFTKKTIKLNKNDIIYLFTDGFADQFGGPNNFKFRYENFQKLLLEIAYLPMIMQKERIIATFESWKEDTEQVDDVMIIGIKHNPEG